MIRVLTNDGLQKGAINKLTSLGFEVVNNHYEKDVLGTTLKEFDIRVIESCDKSYCREFGRGARRKA